MNWYKPSSTVQFLFLYRQFWVNGSCNGRKRKIGGMFPMDLVWLCQKKWKKILIGYRIITCKCWLQTSCVTAICTWEGGSAFTIWILQITSWFCYSSFWSWNPSPILTSVKSVTHQSWKPFYTVISDNIFKKLRCLVSKFKEYLYYMAYTQEKEYNSFINVLQQYLDN